MQIQFRSNAHFPNSKGPRARAHTNSTCKQATSVAIHSWHNVQYSWVLCATMIPLSIPQEYTKYRLSFLWGESNSESLQQLHPRPMTREREAWILFPRPAIPPFDSSFEILSSPVRQTVSSSNALFFLQHWFKAKKKRGLWNLLTRLLTLERLCRKNPSAC